MINREYQWLSALLCYPEAELVAGLPEFQAALAGIPALAPHQIKLQGFMDYLSGHSLRTLQENYVATFDRNRRHALYIFEHVHGEDRDRGSAMLDLLDEYTRHGFELGDDELPDYLPALLEYLAHAKHERAQKLLGDAVHVIEHIRAGLAQNNSPYAALLAVLVVLSPARPQPLIEPPVRDMDEAMAAFGTDVSGVEPLLQPGLDAIRFYPKGRFQAACKGVKA